ASRPAFGSGKRGSATARSQSSCARQFADLRWAALLWRPRLLSLPGPDPKAEPKLTPEGPDSSILGASVDLRVSVVNSDVRNSTTEAQRYHRATKTIDYPCEIDESLVQLSGQRQNLVIPNFVGDRTDLLEANYTVLINQKTFRCAIHTVIDRGATFGIMNNERVGISF